MWVWLALRRWPVQWPVYALVLALGAVPALMLGDYPTGPAPHWGDPLWWISIVVGVSVLALVLALVTGYRFASLRELFGELSFRDCRQVSAAMRFGPVPTDPAIRQAALVLGRRTRDSFAASARLIIAVLLANVVIQVIGFVIDPQHFTLNRLLQVWGFAFLSGYYWYYPRLLDSRLQLLRSGASSDEIPSP